MNRINIYISHHEKDTLDRKCRYYHISLSTLAEKISCLLIDLSNSNDIINVLKIKREYIDKANNYKTSIKPRENGLYTNFLNENCKSIWYSNILKMYANKWTSDYIPYHTEEFYKRLEQILKETKESFYNYNQQIRSMRRALKQNPEYFEKALKHVKAENSGN